jgi:hypothetical protein
MQFGSFSKFVAVVLVALMASTAMAQQPGGRGRGGRGGFGGGFGGSNLATLLGNEAVQKELGLEGDKLEKAKGLREEYQAEFRKAMPTDGFAGLRDLPEAERAAKMAELRTKMTTASAEVAATMKPKVKEVLTAQQFERLQQIHVQAEGIRALNDADVVKSLDISKEQTDKIAAIEKESSDKRRELFRDGGNEGAREKLTALTKERDEKTLAVLSADQREKFSQLKGKEFDVASLRSTNGRTGGRRPGGAGGRPTNRPAGEDNK